MVSRLNKLIDRVILEEGIDLGIYDKMIGLSTYEKKLVVLSEIDKSGVVLRFMRESLAPKSEYAVRIRQLMRDYIPFADTSAKNFGEILTPQSLVLDMTDQLPESVWSNPNLKWLDSCAGFGVFSGVILDRLMVGLSDLIKCENERYKYIVENMIYAAEIQAKNTFMLMCIFDPEDEYDMNVYTGSFLDVSFHSHALKEWGAIAFDIILGNPPFNSSAVGGNGARDLWDKFVIDSMNILSIGGFMCYVHPPKWRSPGHKILGLFKKYNLRYLEIHSKHDGNRLFGAVTRYDFYLLEKSSYGGNTIVLDEKGISHNINIMDWEWIPNYNFDLISSIIADDNEEKLDVVYSRSLYGNDKEWMSKDETDLNNLPCVYGMYRDGSCSYRYSNVSNGHFGVPKVILGLGEKLYPKIDFDGKYGVMNNAFYLPVDTIGDAENIKIAIESEGFKEIIKATKWSNFQVNHKMFNSFKRNFWVEFI